MALFTRPRKFVRARLWLSVIAYNLANLWRRLALPARIDTWSLTSLQQRRMKTGGRLVKHARYYWLLLAEGHLTRRLVGAVMRWLETLSVPTGRSAFAVSLGVKMEMPDKF